MAQVSSVQSCASKSYLTEREEDCSVPTGFLCRRAATPRKVENHSNQFGADDNV